MPVLLAGLPVPVTGVTIGRLYGSSSDERDASGTGVPARMLTHPTHLDGHRPATAARIAGACAQTARIMRTHDVTHACHAASAILE
ncbi:unannotated protein [freshwater metagenome]|uniref:Unannotated protein n=1 Tax=freshwater metagenome TaxID=449393 RepID=A0A6J7JUS7_9ZZZZ